MSESPVEYFLIAQGVHRSVAAREAGLPGVLAQIEVDGKKVGVRVLPLESLVTTKATIARWDRNRDFWELVELLGTVQGRAGIGTIFVNPIPAAVAGRFVRVLDVVVLEEADGDEP